MVKPSKVKAEQKIILLVEGVLSKGILKKEINKLVTAHTEKFNKAWGQ